MRSPISFLLLFVSVLCANHVFAIDHEQFRQDVRDTYLPIVQSRISSMETEVQNNVQNWINDTSDGDWALGNPIPDVLIDIETDWLQEVQTLSCNLSDVSGGFTTHLHSYDDLHTQFKITNESGNLDFGFCDVNIFFEYDPDDSGMEAGECFTLIYIPYFNIFICIWSHVVDYYYPTMKVNFSNQLFYSRYLPIQDVIEHYIQFNLMMQPFMSSLNATQTMWEMYSFVGLLNFQWIDTPALDDIEHAIRGGDRKVGRTVLMGEEDIENDREFFHGPVHDDLNQPFHASDFNSQSLLYWLHESEDRDQQMYDDFLANENEPCVRNNVASGKTPDWPETFRDSSWTAQVSTSGGGDGGIERMPCFKNVGEVSVFTKHRRQHTSDGFWQSYIKGLKDYFIEYPSRRRFSFEQDKERMHYLPEFLSFDDLQRNDEFQSSMDAGTHGVFNCPIINKDSEGDDVVNMDYFEANVIEDRKAKEETTGEVFTAFSGCWSPMPQQFWMLIYRWLPSVHGYFYNTRVD